MPCFVWTANAAKSALVNSSVDVSKHSPATAIHLPSYALLVVVGAVVAAADQITKHLALSRLNDAPIHLIDGILSLRLAFNSGGAFGLGQDFPAVFLVATLVIVAVIFFWVRTVTDRRWITALGMVLGGGIGNVSDRIFRDLDGSVVDFVDLHVWPVFNLADSAIFLGVVAILLLGLRTDPDPRDE